MKVLQTTQSSGYELTPRSAQNAKHLLRKIKDVCIWHAADADTNFAGFVWETIEIIKKRQALVFVEAMQM